MTKYKHHTLEELLSEGDINNEFYVALARFDERCVKQYGFQGFKPSLERLLSRIKSHQRARLRTFIQNEPPIDEVLKGYGSKIRAAATHYVMEHAGDLLDRCVFGDGAPLAYALFAGCSKLRRLDEKNIRRLYDAAVGSHSSENKKKLLGYGVKLLNRGKAHVLSALTTEVSVMSCKSDALASIFLDAAPAFIRIGDSAPEIAAYHLRRLSEFSPKAAEHFAPLLFKYMKEGDNPEALVIIGANILRRSVVGGEAFFQMLPYLLEKDKSLPEKMLADDRVFDAYADFLQSNFRSLEDALEGDMKSMAREFFSDEIVQRRLRSVTLDMLQKIPTEDMLGRQPWSWISSPKVQEGGDTFAEVVYAVKEDKELGDYSFSDLHTSLLAEVMRSIPGFLDVLADPGCGDIYLDMLRRGRKLRDAAFLNIIPAVLPYLHLFAEVENRERYIEVVKGREDVNPQFAAWIATWLPPHLDALKNEKVRERYNLFLREAEGIFYMRPNHVELIIELHRKQLPHVSKPYVERPVTFRDAGEIEAKRKEGVKSLFDLLRLMNEVRKPNKPSIKKLVKRHSRLFPAQMIDEFASLPQSFLEEAIGASPALSELQGRIDKEGKDVIKSVASDDAERYMSELFRLISSSGRFSDVSHDFAQRLRNRLMRPYYFDSLKVMVNHYIHALTDRTGSCVSGPFGRKYQAGFAYLLDDNVILLDLTPHCCDEPMPPIARAILVKARCTALEAGPVLLVDGVFASSDVDFIDSSEDSACEWKSMMYEGILRLADRYCFDRVVLNTEHGTAQSSVHEFTFYVAEQMGLKEGREYSSRESGGVREFVLNPKSMHVGFDDFQGTHYVERPPFNPRMLKAIRDGNLPQHQILKCCDREGNPLEVEYPLIRFLGGEEYGGEQYLDAFHAWNEHEGNPLPVWNDGKGYVKGIELNVKEALSKLSGARTPESVH